jgi:Saxitoxin biosynthesis operon protein SxtJ
MSHLDPKRPATTKELRQFGLLVGGAFGVIAIISFLRHKPTVVPGIFGTLGALLLLAGLAAPGVLSKVYAGWMGLAALLSKVTTPIFMGVIYFVIISPIGSLMRLAGRNKLKSSGDTVWFTRASGQRRGDLERQF